MDPAFLLLIVFMVYSVLLGVCLARMKAINREIDTMKTVIGALGNFQRSDTDSRQGATTKPVELTPDNIRRLSELLGGEDG